MAVRTVRGAITTENTREDILSDTKALIIEIMKQNKIISGDIISIVFSCTRDIDEAYPAVAAREVGITEASLMCLQEMYVRGSMEKCIRLMIMFETSIKQNEIRHVYLKNAVRLRPDLSQKQTLASKLRDYFAYHAKGFQIAVDGPSGSGKSSIAKALAKDLGISYIDTGAMYRAVGLYCLNQGIDLEDQDKIAEALAHDRIQITYSNAHGENAIYLNQQEITKDIRTQQTAMAASKVAVMSNVRFRLVELQKKIAEKENVIMDGRDIGACVLPNAELKIYLDADVESRTLRRIRELEQLNIACDVNKIRQEIIDRDYNDMNRTHSPLRRTEDAVLIDSSQMTFEEVRMRILELIEEQIDRMAMIK